MVQGYPGGWGVCALVSRVNNEWIARDQSRLSSSGEAFRLKEVGFPLVRNDWTVFKGDVCTVSLPNICRIPSPGIVSDLWAFFFNQGNFAKKRWAVVKIQETFRQTGVFLLFFSETFQRAVGFSLKQFFSPQKRLFLIKTISYE